MSDLVISVPMNNESVARAKQDFGQCRVLTYAIPRRGKTYNCDVLAYMYKGSIQLIDKSTFEDYFGYLYALTGKDGFTKAEFRDYLHPSAKLLTVKSF